MTYVVPYSPVKPWTVAEVAPLANCIRFCADEVPTLNNTTNIAIPKRIGFIIDLSRI
jgi:hypothetical protein